VAVVCTGPLWRCLAGDRTGDALARAQAGVLAWRDDLRAAVAAKVQAQLVWDETAATAVRFDLGPAGWPALRLFAFYSERAELEWPDTVPPLLELDPAWREAADGKFGKSHYGQLLACRAWLPGDFPVTLRAPLPDGDTAELGSVVVLADQLRWLNQRTFQGDAQAIVAWRELPAPVGGSLLDAARRGFAMLHAAAELAVAQRLPIVLHEA
jgi:hypothetical protein